MPASIELSVPQRKLALASVQRYSEQTMGEVLGDLAAGQLLDFFLEEIGPLVYNQAVADVQERLQSRLAELHGEVYAEPFLYWPQLEKRMRQRRG